MDDASTRATRVAYSILGLLQATYGYNISKGTLADMAAIIQQAMKDEREEHDRK